MTVLRLLALVAGVALVLLGLAMVIYTLAAQATVTENINIYAPTSLGGIVMVGFGIVLAIMAFRGDGYHGVAGKDLEGLRRRVKDARKRGIRPEDMPPRGPSGA